MPKFPGCQYGPHALRRLLRAHRLPGERLVGWGPARKKADASTHAWIVAMNLAPGIGHGIGAVMLAQLARWVVLTDLRLLVLSCDRSAVKPSEKGLKAEVSLGDATIVEKSRPKRPVPEQAAKKPLARKFQISWVELGKPLALEIQIPAKAPATQRRLGDALSLLATAPEEATERP